MTARTPRFESIFKAKETSPHICKIPRRSSDSVVGDVVRLECGHFWHVYWQDQGLGLLMPGWGRVRPWNLLAWARILFLRRG